MQTKRAFQFIFTGTLLALALLTARPATAQNSLETELLNVISAKSAAYYAADTDLWQTFWIKDAQSSRSIVSKFGYSGQIGWESLVATLKKDSQEMGRVAVKLTIDHVHIRSSGTMAFVEADEHWRSSKTDSLIGNTHVYTVLMQENKVWKIANQIRVGIESYTINARNREDELNTIGYDLLQEKRTSEAIDVFAVNVKLNPTSWNAYDSLGEGYALAGNKKLAIANYEKSLELNRDNESGKKALAILKQK